MKKLIPLIICWLCSFAAHAQTASFAVTTTPCHNDGVLTATFTGLSPPLSVTWTTMGLSGASVVHAGVSGLTDALSGYSGGEVSISATDGTGTAYGYFTGMPPFTYSVTATPAVCPALGTATAAVTGGTAPYTYQWFDPATMATVGTTNPISLASGMYGITITDAAGCTYGSLVSADSGVYVPSAPAFSVAVTTTIASCTNGTATVGAITGGTAPFSYLWSNAATTPAISSLIMGSYSVVVTDASGCSATAYAYVSQSITITPHITTTPATCVASDGAVVAFGSGGLPPYTYLWSNGATTASQTGLSAGAYSVGITDANGCIGSGYSYVSASTPITVTYSATASICTAPTGTATLTLAGGTTPYTITWYTTPPQTGTTATALAPGDYYFTVTDAVGCLRDGTATVPAIEAMSATSTATAAHCTSATGALTAIPAGGTAPYAYSWSTGATTAGISSLHAGSYDVTITDAIGCHISKYWSVPDYSPVALGLSGVPASCIFASDGSLTALPSGGTAPYTYSWTSSGSTTATASSLTTGYYYVSVTDATGCTANNSTFLGYNPTATSCYCTISGTVYNDINNNCVQDPGENGIPNIQIYCSGIGYTYTDVSGNYSFIVPTGSYTITETILAFYPLSSCQANGIPVSVTAASGCIHTVNFGNTIDIIHDMHISTWDYNWAIPGHTYTQATIISNDGTVTETAALAGYKPDGQLFAPSFVPAGVFSGAPYWYTSGTALPTIAAGHTQSYLGNYTVPASIPLGTSVVFKDSVAYTAPMSNWLTDYSPWNNVDYFTTTTVSSYDPNFKEVSPKGTGAAGTITYADSTLEYMVHFQNTGTSPAEKVVVIDTLDNNLDWTTLRPVYMSTNCKVTLVQAGTYKIAKFTFADINLPPASSEPVTSNGMFTYTIKTMHGLHVGSTFRNSASIYFDYNAPVKTNTTLNTLGSTLATLGTNPATLSAADAFQVYPNPAGNTFSAIITSAEAADADLKVTDITGKLLITKTIALQKGSQSVANDVSSLTPGIYFVSLTRNGQSQTQKLVIMK